MKMIELSSLSLSQPLIREKAVLALKACLRLVAERENKETVNSRYYEVSLLLVLNLLF